MTIDIKLSDVTDCGETATSLGNTLQTATGAESVNTVIDQDSQEKCGAPRRRRIFGGRRMLTINDVGFSSTLIVSQENASAAQDTLEDTESLSSKIANGTGATVEDIGEVTIVGNSYF